MLSNSAEIIWYVDNLTVNVMMSFDVTMKIVLMFGFISNVSGSRKSQKGHIIVNNVNRISQNYQKRSKTQVV